MRQTILFITFLLMLTACRKNNKEEPAPPTREEPENPPPGREAPQLFQLRSVEYNTGTRLELEYNTDKSLRQIVRYMAGYITHIYFQYDERKRLVETAYEEALFTNYYDYTEDGVSIVANRPKDDNTRLAFQMDYAYNQDGKVASMNYRLNSSPDPYMIGWRYEYDGQGMLRKIVSKSNEDLIYIYRIDSYSDSCSLTPWLFVSPETTELFPLQNYPVLRTMYRLPSKVTRLEMRDGVEKAVKIHEYDFSIVNKRVNEFVLTISYPDRPGESASSKVILRY